MRRVNLVLENDALYGALEAEASSTGRSVEEVIINALEQWLAESEMDEKERAETEDALREWEETGGIEVHEFFRKLREEETE